MRILPKKNIIIFSTANKDFVIEEFSKYIQFTPVRLFKNDSSKIFAGEQTDSNKFIFYRKHQGRRTITPNIKLEIIEDPHGCKLVFEIKGNSLGAFFFILFSTALIILGIQNYIATYSYEMLLFFLFIILGFILISAISYHFEYDNSVQEINKILKRIKIKNAS
jgi:hypothetical protein